MTSPLGRFLIICGAEKCGTTSLFGYLASHPDVRASLEKETDHFRRPDADLGSYLQRFPTDARAAPLHLESSPGYLAEADQVAPRLAQTLPQAQLLFVLRDPVDRLRSAYRFYQSRLHLPAGMSFDLFVSLCLDHDDGSLAAPPPGVLDWHLRAAMRGRYEKLLPWFEAHYAASRFHLVHYEDLRRDARATVKDICRFAGLDASHFANHAFTRENVSFGVRNRAIQRLAVQVNDGLEGLWRRHPGLKRSLLGWYKRFNAVPLQEDRLSQDTAGRLEAYYAPTAAFLRSRFG